MRTPRFRLLLELAQTQEADIRREVGRLEGMAESIRTRIIAVENERQAAVAGGLPLRDLWSAWWLRVDDEIAAERQRLAKIEAECDTVRQRLAEAHRQVRTWELLRERDAVAIRVQAERRQARELDDLGLRGWEGR